MYQTSIQIYLISAFVVIAIICFYFLKMEYKKHLAQLLTLIEMKYSIRLIETLYSERHDYQNSLQVMKFMAAMGATRQLEDYLTKVVNHMTKSSGFTKINDPILAASIITHQVKAKEYNIMIKVNCAASLLNIADISIRLGEVFDTFLDLLMDSMISVKNSGHEIIIDIDEGIGEYSFDFRIGGETGFINKLTANNVIESGKTEHVDKLNYVQKIIKDLKGDFYFVAGNERILRLKMTIAKKELKALFISDKASSF